MKTPETTVAENEDGKKPKPPRLVKTGLATVILLVAALAVYVFSLGPVLWLSGARTGKWYERLPHMVQAVYDPVLSFPGVPGWYDAYLSLFIRQPPPQIVELALSPGTKVTLHVPKEWTAQAQGTDPSVQLMTSAPSDVASVPRSAVNFVAILNFTPGESESIKQEDMDKLLEIEDAGMAKDTPEKQVNPVEMKSDSGIGAYTVFSMDMDMDMDWHISTMSNATPNYTKMADGLFLTHGVLVRFAMVAPADLPQLVKFIEEGITVDSAKQEDGQALELKMLPKEKLKLQVPAGWTRYVIGVGSYQVFMESPAGMKMKLFAVLPAGVTFKPPITGPEDLVGKQAGAWPAEEQSPPVELKSKAGHGAYAVRQSRVKSATGAFAAGDVIVIFSSDNIGDEKSADFQQAVKFIEEGISMETEKMTNNQ